MRHSYRKGAVGVAVAAVGLAAFAGPALADTSSPSVALKGSVPSWAHTSAAKGHASGSSAVRLTVVLNLRNPQGAAKLAAAVSDPSSSQYGRYLSADAYRARFAPTSSDVAKVTHWLSHAGLRVVDIPANHTLGHRDRHARPGRTGLRDHHRLLRGQRRYRHRPGQRGQGPGLGRRPRCGRRGPHQPGAPQRSDVLDGPRPRPPANVRSANAGPPTEGPAAAAFVNAAPCSTYFGQKTATTLPKAYGIHARVRGVRLHPVAAARGVRHVRRGRQGPDRQGVTVAIVDAYASPTILSDANTYAVKNGEQAFAPGQFQQISAKPYRYGYYDKVNGDLCGEQGWYGEETLDVEAVHSMAPGANVLYVAGRSCDDPDLMAALNKIVDDHLADIISDSWGGVGRADPVTQAAAAGVHQTFLQAAARGHRRLFSSGDNGDERLTPAYRTADFPASHPLVTAVGGTSLAVGKGNSSWETGWGTKKSVLTDGAWDPAPPGNYLYGAGGGTSRLFAEPFYQKGVVPSSIANYFKGGPGRAVPDIAADADPNTGMLVGQTQTFPDGTVKYASTASAAPASPARSSPASRRSPTRRPVTRTGS